MQKKEKRGVGRPSNPNRKQRINVTFHPTTLAELEARIPEKQRSTYIEQLVRTDLGLSELKEDR
jgi:hypothetical protein